MRRLLVNGKLALVHGLLVDQSCSECCEPQACTFVYRAESCNPILPPVVGCDFSRPPDIFICTDTLCANDNLPVSPPLPDGTPGDVVYVNGQCYQVTNPPIPRNDADGFVYDLPTVECLLDCNATACIPVSPFSLAEPCNPNCPPLFFCRSQFSSCRVIRVRFGGVDPPTGPGCCYRFDPTLPPTLPPPSVVVCTPVVSQGGVNVGSNCQLLDFGGLTTATLGTTSCCECGDRGATVTGDCNYHRVPADAINDWLCSTVSQYDVCCPRITPATRILVDFYVHIYQPPPYGGPTGYGNSWTDGSGTFVPLDPNADNTVFTGNVHSIARNGPFPVWTGIPPTNLPQDGPFPSDGEGSAQFCPLFPVGNWLPPLQFGLCADAEFTCECFESFYDGLTLRTRWRVTWRDSTNGNAVIQVTDVFINLRVVNVGSFPPGCTGGCMGRTASAQGSDNGTIRIRGGGSRVPFGVKGEVVVEEWL